MSPTAWLLERRVEHAPYLLETTDLPIEQVARESGFGTSAALRIRFYAFVGVSPSAYRDTFRHREIDPGA